MDTPVSRARTATETANFEPEAQDFSDQAKRAGLTLPQPRPLNPALAVLVVVAIVVASIGIGKATGWLNPTASPPNSLGCGGVAAHLRGGVSTDSTTVSRVVESIGSQFVNTTAGCGSVTVTFSPSPQNGSLAPLSHRQVDFMIVPSVPPSNELAGLPQPAVVTPIALTGIGVAVNLPGASPALNLTGAALAGIYRGVITKWSDPLIAQFNPGVVWPSDPTIHPLFRSGTSALNLAFTKYLAGANGSWSTTVGTGSSVHWPAGTGFNSTEAMLTVLSATPGAIGYLEVGSQGGSGLRFAQVENPAGVFVAPNASSISTAVTSALASDTNVTNLTEGFWANLTTINAPGSASYPIPIFSYLLVYGDLGHAYGTALSGFSARILSILLWWIATSGQSVSVAAGLTALPPTVSAFTERCLNELSFNGTPLYSLPNPEGGESGGNETGKF